MAAELQPLPTGFFPVARLALLAGALAAAFGAAFLKGDPEAPPVAAPVTAPAALGGPVVAHVWLENCADCMSAFQAHALVQQQDALAGMKQVNVAYGVSTPAFRAKYRVDTNVIEDIDGSQVVQRYGISSFTTLVLDGQGNVLLSDRPDRPGYVERVRAAWARAR